jgi:CDP-glycerol glycerophosphotransferase (TagB/SpsB family)
LQEKYGYFLVIETGWPKVDYILNYPTQNIKTKLGIPQDKKIILYAPTFSAKMESATELKEVIPKIINKDEFWLFKFHELMDPEVVDIFKQIEPNKSEVLEIADITPYLHVADVMISDTSSVIYEFMLLDKPVITYKTQSRKDKGINISDPSKLREAIDTCLHDPENHKIERRQHINDINPYIDGKISENVFRELEAVIKEDKLPQKRKPLNLFRKMQIIYHGIFRKGYLR